MNAMQRNSRLWLAALYSLGVMLIVLPIWEGLARLGEPAPSQVMWRAASVVSMAGVLMIPVAGYVLALGIALFAGHRRTLLAGGILGLVAAVALPAATGLVTLDSLQMRRAVVPERLGIYDHLLIRTNLSLLLFTMTMGCASLGAIRMSRRMAPAAATSPVRERGILTTRQAEARG